MSRRYDLIMFDFDGTLADSLPWLRQALNGAAERYRFRPIREDEVERLRGLDARGLMQHLGVSPWKVPWMAFELKRAMTREAGQIAPFPGAAAVLEALATRGVQLALVTSNRLENVRRILGPGSVERFAACECDVSLFGKKARFRRVLRRLGIAPGRALYIGDEVRDADAARAARVPFGAVAWGYTTVAALERSGPAHVFHAMTDIPGVLEG